VTFRLWTAFTSAVGERCRHYLHIHIIILLHSSRELIELLQCSSASYLSRATMVLLVQFSKRLCELEATDSDFSENNLTDPKLAMHIGFLASSPATMVLLLQ